MDHAPLEKSESDVCACNFSFYIFFLYLSAEYILEYGLNTLWKAFSICGIKKLMLPDPISRFVPGFRHDRLRVISNIRVAYSTGFEKIPAVSQLYSTLKKWMRN